MCGLDLILEIVINGADTKGASITVILDWGIAIEHNGRDLTSAIIKFEVHA
jgi:hypothetical protein